jgi:hypothetical protein
MNIHISQRVINFYLNVNPTSHWRHVMWTRLIMFRHFGSEATKFNKSLIIRDCEFIERL